MEAAAQHHPSGGRMPCMPMSPKITHREVFVSMEVSRAAAGVCVQPPPQRAWPAASVGLWPPSPLPPPCSRTVGLQLLEVMSPTCDTLVDELDLVVQVFVEVLVRGVGHSRGGGRGRGRIPRRGHSGSSRGRRRGGGRRAHTATLAARGRRISHHDTTRQQREETEGTGGETEEGAA